MAVASSSALDVDPAPADACPSKSPSDIGSPASATAVFSASLDADTPEYCDPSNSSPSSLRDAEIQSATSLKSEEYRQLFRLPPEEVLVEDFNCACQENILVQGHMYLFVHYICFYSNIFGFETKKIVHFGDVTSVKRAKTAGIFPNAIEILAGGKKHFFASFLSRDEAFKLIIDGWTQHGTGASALMEKQDSSSESSFRENGLEPEKVKNSNCSDDLEISNRSEDAVAPDDSAVTLNTQEDNALSKVQELQDDVESDTEAVLVSESPSLTKTWTWKVEDSDAPKISEEYTKVAESKFVIKVEDFFNLFFSDDAVDFIESFHKKCGDRDFKCTLWSPHDQFGHTRNVSFQHPIKLYLGAKFGSCQELQKSKVYKDSHLVIETSQGINDVPYGDYFRVEGLWDIRRDNEESCILSVYINVAFSRKTMFKAKIVQSTLEECREAYAVFVNMAHELLRERNLEKLKGNNVGSGPDSRTIPRAEALSETESKVVPSEANIVLPDATNTSRVRQLPGSTGTDQYDRSHFQGNLKNSASSIIPVLRSNLSKFWSDIRSQTHLPPLIAISFIVILLMQMSIVVLLTRPQNIQIISPRDYIGGIGVGERSPEMVALFEKRFNNLKDEMSVVESRLERMRWEHVRLKEQLRDLERLHKDHKS